MDYDIKITGSRDMLFNNIDELLEGQDIYICLGILNEMIYRLEKEIIIT